MAKAKDLTGQRFGRLTVLELAEPYITPGGKKSRRWRCRCDCGNEIIVPQNVLVSKTGTRSCGCARRERTRAAAQDMTGQRFGRLTVLAPADLPKARANGLRMGWRCRCDCGREIITTRNDLLSGRKLSCGCLRAEAATQRVAVDVGHYAGTTISAIRADRPANRNSKSGVKGVYWSEREQRWIAKITVQRKQITLGRYITMEDAAAARKAAEEKYFAPIIADYEETNKNKKGGD